MMMALHMRAARGPRVGACAMGPFASNASRAEVRRVRQAGLPPYRLQARHCPRAVADDGVNCVDLDGTRLFAIVSAVIRRATISEIAKQKWLWLAGCCPTARRFRARSPLSVAFTRDHLCRLFFSDEHAVYLASCGNTMRRTRRSAFCRPLFHGGSGPTAAPRGILRTGLLLPRRQERVLSFSRAATRSSFGPQMPGAPSLRFSTMPTP
jgi:hypothetical protein